jgi:tetratricopeptide (TPR) repeat protein
MIVDRFGRLIAPIALGAMLTHDPAMAVRAYPAAHAHVLQAPGSGGAQASVDPSLEAAVHAYFDTQAAEDVPGYLALWSRNGHRPSATMLKFIFDSGDDRFSEITISRVDQIADGTRVRVSAQRDRSSANAQGVASTSHVRISANLIYTMEDGSWKLVRESPAADELASDLLAAPTPEARETLLTAEPNLVNSRLVDALARRGVEAIRTQRHGEALAIYQLALGIARRVGDRKSEGESLQNVANAYYFQRNFPQALEAYQQRLAVETEREDDAGIAASLVGIATIRYTFAEYGVALGTYRDALAIQTHFPDQTGAASTLISTGNIQYLLGDYPAAIADYRRSRDLYRTAAYTEGEAVALGGLGRVYVAQGNYAAALDAFAGVLAEGRARSHRPSQGMALMSIGEIHVRLGNLTAGRAALEESRGHFEASGDPANTGRVWQDLAYADLVAGAFASAERGYTRSVEACNMASDRDCIAVAKLGLAFAQTTQDKFAEGAASYRNAIEAFNKLGRTELAARGEVGLAQALTGLGEYDDALAAAGRARQTAVGTATDDVLWRALVAEARA